MLKQTLMALIAMAALGFTVPGFAENADEANLEKHEDERDASAAKREANAEIRAEHQDNRDDNQATVDQNARDVRDDNQAHAQDHRDANKNAQNARQDVKNTIETGVSVKVDSEGRKCVYIDDDGESKIRHSCK